MLMANKVGVITGATNGIGRACVDLFLAEGATVIAMDLVEPAAPIEGVAAFIKADVAEPASIERAFADIRARFDRLDFAVNNAGVTLEGEPTPEWTDTHYGRTIAINLDGVFLCTQALVPALAETRGAIVNIASISGLRASTLRVAYGTSKAAVIHLTKQFAAELGEQGIRVNCIAPGPVRTKLAMAVHAPEIIAAYYDAIPLNRYGEAREIGEGIAFLLSEAASFVTGQTLAVDGGFDATGVGLPALRRED